MPIKKLNHLSFADLLAIHEFCSDREEIDKEEGGEDEKFERISMACVLEMEFRVMELEDAGNEIHDALCKMGEENKKKEA